MEANTERKPYEIARDERNVLIDAAISDFSMVATYIPFNVDSLREKSNDPNFHGKGAITVDALNRLQFRYTVELSYKGRAFLTTPYRMGTGAIPEGSGPKGQRGWTTDKIKWITEVMATGLAGKWSDTYGQLNKKPILPKLRDVVWSLIMDGNAIDHRDFEDWASDFGYDTDSRKAEATYRACLDIGLKMRNTLGESKLEKLREVYQDY